MRATFGRFAIPVTVVKRGLIGRQNTSANGRKGCYVMAYREVLRVVPSALGRPLVASEVNATTLKDNVVFINPRSAGYVATTLNAIEGGIVSGRSALSQGLSIAVPFIYPAAFAGGSSTDVGDRVRQVVADDTITFRLYDGNELVYTSPPTEVHAGSQVSNTRIVELGRWTAQSWYIELEAAGVGARFLPNASMLVNGLGFELDEGSTTIIPLSVEGQNFAPFEVWAEVEGDLVTPGNLVVGLSGEIGELPVRIVKFRCRVDERLNNARRVDWNGVSWFVDSLRQVSGREFNIDLRRVI